MNIEQRLAEAIQSFGFDIALSGPAPIPSAPRRRLPGYGTATPTPSSAGSCPPAETVITQGGQITITLNRRTYSLVLRQASLPETITVPWWQDRNLRYEYA